MQRHKRIDQRKTASAETNAKKADAGRKGKGFTAFAPKICKSEAKLLERIELVVKMAEMANTVVNAEDVIRHNRSRLLYHSLGAHKIA
jgi:hypothetical protein